MRTRSPRLLLVVAAAGLTLGLAGCSSGDGQVSAQQARNDAAEQLAAAQRATLVPVASRIDALARQQQGGTGAGELDAYRALARSVEAAHSAGAVHELVDRSGLDLGRSAGDVLAAG